MVFISIAESLLSVEFPKTIMSQTWAQKLPGDLVLSPAGRNCLQEGTRFILQG